MARLYRPLRDDHVTDGAEVLDGPARTIATEQLVPRIAARNNIAIKTVRISTYFYAKVRAGRQCSCFDLDVSPNASCRCCYGTGKVGGYDKYGTITEVIDVTRPDLRTVNIMPDYSRNAKPRQFRLIDGTTSGYLDARVRLKANTGEVDHIFVTSESPPASTIEMWLRAPGDVDYLPFTEATLKQRLVNDYIDVRMIMRRPTVGSDSPLFGMLFIRYRKLTNFTVLANIPLTSKSDLLSDYGVADDWEAQHFWLDNTIRSVTTEDWVAHINENTRWKISTVREFAVEDQLVSWDLDTRLMQAYEPANNFPI